ncbi:NADPH-dependent FMN reductase [Candidatus Leptofilum sp.]|uniref:NADPH-dependent FMN reductase n=1 Tax=Candidatus Leptofilum sp. TaxID=3241576 RepID=UPI003B5AB6F3
MTNNTIRILGFAGSLRQRSYNRALLNAATTMLPDGVTLECFDLASIPLFDADLEAEGLPTAVAHFYDQMRQADALLIASPEYNYSVTGVLKNALDWASRKGNGDTAPLDGKTAAIIGSGGMHGTLRSQLHLREILAHNEIFVLRQSLMLARGYTHFDDDLNLTDEKSRERLAKLLISLRDWTLRLNQ